MINDIAIDVFIFLIRIMNEKLWQVPDFPLFDDERFDIQVPNKIWLSNFSSQHHALFVEVFGLINLLLCFGEKSNFGDILNLRSGIHDFLLSCG